MADARKLGGAASAKVKLDDAAFGQPFNGPLVHESVRAELAARRQGTHSTKTRGMVRGGGAKPWRQKGTGRARAGSNRSPIWAGGATVFGPQPRDYGYRVPAKARRVALRSVLADRQRNGALTIVDSIDLAEAKTKRVVELLSALGLTG